MSETAIPEFGFLRVTDVIKIIPIGKSTWWLWVKEGKAPKPLKLSKNVAVWKVEDIRALCEKLAA